MLVGEVGRARPTSIGQGCQPMFQGFGVRSWLVVGVVAASVLVPVSAVAAPSPSGSANDVGAGLPSVPGVPVLARTWIGNTTDGKSAVLTVHGVRRVKDATVVYYSMGIPQGSPQASPYFAAYGGGFYNTLAQSKGGTGGALLCDVAAIDVAGGKAYTALRDGGPSCPSVDIHDFQADSEAPNSAVVGWTLVAPIPESVSRVDVYIGSQLLQDVPVEDGLLEPMVEEKAPKVGMGWPRIDVAALVKTVVEPQGAVFPLSTRVVDDVSKATTTEGAGGEAVELPADVLFEFDQATLTSAADAAIAAAVGKITAKASGGAVTVTGYTDSEGSDGYNQELSQRRAEAVKVALVASLPGGYTVTAVGKGEADPIADNNSDQGRALNRRVTITLPR